MVISAERLEGAVPALLSCLCTGCPCKGLGDQNQNKIPSATWHHWQAPPAALLATSNQTAWTPPAQRCQHHILARGGTEPRRDWLHGDAGIGQRRATSQRLPSHAAACPGPCHAAHEAAGRRATRGREERAVHTAAQLADHGDNCTKDTSRGRGRDPSPCPRTPPQPPDRAKHVQRFPCCHM